MSVVVAAGIVIGVLLGLLGGGGSILAVPALGYGVGEPLDRAVPASLLVVAVSSVTALLPRLRSRLVRWRIALVVGAAGMVAAVAGAAVNRSLPDDVVLLGFAVVMVAAGLRMLRPHRVVGGDCALPGGGVDWRGCLPKSIGTGALVGMLTGLFGVGGGFVVVPALVLLLGLPMAVAVGTSLVIVALNSAAGFAAHAGAAELDWTTLGAFAGAAGAASLAASRFAPRLDAVRLQHGFGWLVLLTAAVVAGGTAFA